MSVRKIDDMRVDRTLEKPPEEFSESRCIYFPKEICLAPKKLRFNICNACVRVDSRHASKNVFQKVKALAIFLMKGLDRPTNKPRTPRVNPPRPQP